MLKKSLSTPLSCADRDRSQMNAIAHARRINRLGIVAVFLGEINHYDVYAYTKRNILFDHIVTSFIIKKTDVLHR